MQSNLIISKSYAEISPAPILHLHRHEDGYIAFAARRDSEDFRPRLAILGSELETWFPTFRDDFLKDAYVGINADWRLRTYGKDGRVHGYPLHRCDKLRYINAAYVDIDCYKLGVSPGSVIGRVIDLQLSGQLPYASMIAYSGRGVWLLWLICDPKNPEQSQGAFPEKLDLYSRIQESIIERLLPLGADMAARDAARYIRIPGSLNTASETKVEWLIQAGAGDGGHTYTLQELAKALKATPTRRHGREIIAHNPRKRRGWVALNARRLRDFNVLRALRGGFSEGCRNNAAKIYAWLLGCNAVGPADVHAMVSAMGEECHPRLQKSEIKDAVKYAQKMRRMRESTISDWLNVTISEAERLEGFPPASTNGRTTEASALKPMLRQLQRQVIVARRAAIQAAITEIGSVPSVRRMAAMLDLKGIKTNRQTVSLDYQLLGIGAIIQTQTNLFLTPQTSIPKKTSEPILSSTVCKDLLTA